MTMGLIKLHNESDYKEDMDSSMCRFSELPTPCAFFEEHSKALCIKVSGDSSHFNIFNFEEQCLCTYMGH